MCLNTKHDVDKLQRLQNRALRLIYNIQNPRNIGINELHLLSKVDKLEKRRKLQLLNIMFALKRQSQFELVRDRITQATEKIYI